MIRMFDRIRRVRLLVALLVTAALVILTIDYRSHGKGPLEAVARGVMTVLGPIQEGLAKIGRPIGHFFAGFTQVASMRGRINELESENAALRLKLEQVPDIFRENDRLQRLLDLPGHLALETMAARVIAVGPSNFERSLIIDRGTRDGVRKGMPVMAGDGLVGRVIIAGPSTSEVLLIVDRQSSVAGRLSLRGETGVVNGSGGADLRFELFAADAPVDVGEQVVTSGYDGGVYPAGIPIGTVVKVPKRHQALSKTVTVRPHVDFSSLDFVQLVLRANRPPRAAPSGSATPGAGGDGR